MKMSLSVITKNLNWEMLTRIWLLLKDGMGLKVEKFNIMWAHWKIHFQGGGGSQETNIQGGIIQKRGLGQFVDLREGGLAKKRAMHFIQIISSKQAEFLYPVFFELV